MLPYPSAVPAAPPAATPITLFTQCSPHKEKRAGDDLNAYTAVVEVLHTTWGCLHASMSQHPLTRSGLACFTAARAAPAKAAGSPAAECRCCRPGTPLPRLLTALPLAGLGGSALHWHPTPLPEPVQRNMAGSEQLLLPAGSKDYRVLLLIVALIGEFVQGKQCSAREGQGAACGWGACARKWARGRAIHVMIAVEERWQLRASVAALLLQRRRRCRRAAAAAAARR